MTSRVPPLFGSVLLLVGAFLVGWVLHHTIVVGDVAPTSPVAVVVALAGLALIAGGRSLEEEFDPSDYVGGEEEEEDDEDAFDETMSPLDEEMLEGRDRDEG